MKDPGSWSQHGHRKHRHDEETLLSETKNNKMELFTYFLITNQSRDPSETSHDIIRVRRLKIDKQ